jgi:hypothetical protein
MFAVVITGILHQSFFGIKGTALFYCQNSEKGRDMIPNRHRLERLFLHEEYDLFEYPLMMLSLRTFCLQGHLPMLYMVINSFVMLFEWPAITHPMVAEHHSIKSSPSTSKNSGGK